MALGPFGPNIMNYLLYQSQPTKTTSIRTNCTHYMDISNTNRSTKILTKIIEKMEI